MPQADVLLERRFPIAMERSLQLEVEFIYYAFKSDPVLGIGLAETQRHGPLEATRLLNNLEWVK